MVWLMTLLTVHEYIVPPWGATPMCKGDVITGLYKRPDFILQSVRLILILWSHELGLSVIFWICGKT